MNAESLLELLKEKTIPKESIYNFALDNLISLHPLISRREFNRTYFSWNEIVENKLPSLIEVKHLAYKSNPTYIKIKRILENKDISIDYLLNNILDSTHLLTFKYKWLPDVPLKDLLDFLEIEKELRNA